MSKDYVTTSQAAKLMRCSVSTVRNVCNRGLLCFWRLPLGARRIGLVDLRLYMQENRLPVDLLDSWKG